MNVHRLFKIGQRLATNLIKATYRNTLIAKWEEIPMVGTWNEVVGRYEDDLGNAIAPIPHELGIPALFDEAPNIKFKYAKYGVVPETDIVAIVPEDVVLPDTTALYYRAGDTKTAYKLKNIINKADIGVANDATLPQVAYKVLHLRNNSLDG